MQKIVVFSLLLLIILGSCSSNDKQNKVLENRIQVLEKKLDSSYKPGLGEFMSALQVHHAKLWFAGKNLNWELANFEIDEIKETIDNIKKYCGDRTELQSLPMIQAAFDSVTLAIQQKKVKLFELNFTILTNTCNNCHQITKHSFNVIRIPDKPPFSNQIFTYTK